MGVAAASGQLIGGLLIHLDIAGSGWRSIFLVNVPIGIAALVAAPRLLPDTRVATPRPDVVETRPRGRRADRARAAAGPGAEPGLAAVDLADPRRRRGARRPRRPPGRRAAPPRDRSPRRRRADARRPVGAGQLGQFLLFTGMAAYFLVLALYLQDGRGLGPLASGTVFTAVAVPYMVGTRNAARVLGRFGARGGIALAALTFGAGHALLLAAVAEIGVGGSVLWLVPGLAVGGVGMGVTLSGLVGSRDGLGPAAARGHRVRHVVHAAAGRERRRRRPGRDHLLRPARPRHGRTPSRRAWSTWWRPRWRSRWPRRSSPAGRGPPSTSRVSRWSWPPARRPRRRGPSHRPRRPRPARRGRRGRGRSPSGRAAR